MDFEDANYGAINIPVTRRWHPRMTPYRMIVMLTGIGLGTAKAILVWRGQTIAPVTLEWIAGVVVSLSFQFLGVYESKPEEEVPYYLEWLFSVDCTKVLWATPAPFSVTRPTYRNDENLVVFRPVPSSMHPPMTGYRLLVCGVVMSFGTVKMLCGYLGLNTAANTFDWAFGTVAMTVLYYLGLYENNTVGLLPLLFATNYWENVYLGLYIAMYLMGIAVCIAWIGFCLEFLLSIPEELYSVPTSKTGTPPYLRPTPIDELHNCTIMLMWFNVMAACAAAGVVYLICLLLSMKGVFKAIRNGVRLVWNFMGRHFSSKLYGLGILPDSEILRRIYLFGVHILVSLHIYATICTYIIIYTFFHLICASFFVVATMFLLGCGIRYAFALDLDDSFVLRICCGVMVCGCAAISILPLCMIYLSLQSLFKALLMYYQTKDVKRSFTTIHFNVGAM